MTVKRTGSDVSFREDEILARVMRVRARLGLIEAEYKLPRVVTEIRLLDEVIVLLLPRGDGGDPVGELEG